MCGVFQIKLGISALKCLGLSDAHIRPQSGDLQIRLSDRDPQHIVGKDHTVQLCVEPQCNSAPGVAIFICLEAERLIEI